MKVFWLCLPPLKAPSFYILDNIGLKWALLTIYGLFILNTILRLIYIFNKIFSVLTSLEYTETLSMTWTKSLDIFESTSEKKTFSDSSLSIFTEWKSKIFTFYRTYCWTIFCVSIPAKYWVIKMTFPIKKLKTVLITIVFISTSICFYIDVYFKYMLYLILLLVVIQIRKLDEDFKNLLSSNM